MAANPDIEQLLQVEHAREIQQMKPAGAPLKREFTAVSEDRYKLAVPELGVTLEIDRLRREHQELLGELSVYCQLPGARTVNGTLSIADFNLSSARARSDRAKLLGERSNAKEVDWQALVEELCQRILQADRAGQPAVDLRMLPAPAAEDTLNVEGLYLLRRHPTILFGDGGAAKSYLGLYLAGLLSERGVRVGLFDWELAGEDHRERLGRLFPDGMPRILYVRCERPLVHEIDRLRRIVTEQELQYLVYDSVAFACDGPPEAAEVAGRYFRAVRQIGGGSLHIAHVAKGENADQKPFGSAFWHNGARSTWYAQLAGADSNSETLSLGLFNRKANLGRLRAPIGFTITFTENRTTFRRSDVADNPDLAGKLNIRQRMFALLRKRPMSPEQIAEEIEAEVETVQRTVRRHKNLFVMIPDGRVALLERSTS